MTESTLASSRRDPTPQRPNARLWVVYPPDATTPIELGDARTTIGRTATGPLAHRTVSRQHFTIEWDASITRYVGEDLGSKNGSWVDATGLVSARRALEDATVVRLGDTLLVLEVDPVAIVDTTVIDPEAIPGVASATRRLRAQVATAARDPSPVLLLGETGVGKERIAAEIHRASGRTGPFQAINCAELTAELVESQLFGHARGAFTGAHRDQIGLFRSASNGTILLDEIGELPLSLQPKLLRVLQENEVLPVGEQRPVPIDVRVIAATNSDLPEAVTAGEFRRDLYARLAFWEIRVPPLRERRADLMGWLARLHQRWSARRDSGIRALDFEPKAVEAILLAPWLDNLRGLDRLVHRLATEPHASISIADVEPLLGPRPVTKPASLPVVKRDAPTADELRAALAEHGGSVRAVAKYYGRDRKQIYRWLKEHGLESAIPRR